MRSKDFVIRELFDPEKKYTGGSTPPPPNTPRGGGGPWEPEPDDEWWKREFREFAKTLKYDLSKAGMNILYPRNPNEMTPLFDANYNVSFKEGNTSIRVLAQPIVYKEDKIVEAAVRIMFFEKDESDKLFGSKDIGEKKLRGNISNLEHVEWIISKIKAEVLRIKKNKPLKETTLTEAATDILYHYMPLYSAVDTLRNNYYTLESSTGMDVESKFAPPGKPWYLATTRSKVGDYTVKQSGYSGAVFVLNGRWLNTRYETKPVDYWEGMYRPSEFNRGADARTSESEDRVFSDKEYIPLKNSTTELHLLLMPFDQITYASEENYKRRVKETVDCLKLASQRNIPAYLYDNKEHWLTQHPKYRIDPNSEQGRNLLSGGVEPTTPLRFRPPSDYYAGIKFWVELLTKDVNDPISDNARKLLYNIRYYSDAANQLKNDMHNAARDPGDPSRQYLRVINDFASKFERKYNKKIMAKDIQAIIKEKWKNLNAS